MTTYVFLRHPVTILVTDFTKPNNLTGDLLIFNSLTLHKPLKQTDKFFNTINGGVPILSIN